MSLLGYLDGGSGSLLLQVIIGGSAGLMVFARYFWASINPFPRRHQDNDLLASQSGEFRTALPSRDNAPNSEPLRERKDAA